MQLVQLARAARSAPTVIETGPRWGDLGLTCTTLTAELADDLAHVGRYLGQFRDRTLRAAATYQDMEASNTAHAGALARSLETPEAPGYAWAPDDVWLALDQRAS